MIYFTSDLHLGHGNIIKHCGRPFADAAEMDAVLIRNWQARVTERDTVYILGDLFFPPNYDHERALKKLKGIKHLIVGNHDKNWMKKVNLPKFFKSVQAECTVQYRERRLFLCHVPRCAFDGDYMLFGHIHNNKNDEIWPALKAMGNALNASVEINGYMPVTF
jgi:calcineurin-like phosphoesterase family protein